MVQLIWEKQTSHPRAIQDCGIAIVNGQIITIGGYCSGPMSGAVISDQKYKKQYRVKRAKYVRGFSPLVHSLSLGLEFSSQNWRQLANFPATARASMGVTSIKDKIYCWGGYSFQPSKGVENLPLKQRPAKDAYTAHIGGFVYDVASNQWNKLPNLPYATTNLNLTNDGRYIYFFGGATVKKGTKSPNTAESGNKCWMIDTNIESVWIQLPDCPGTTRMDASLTYHDGHLYLIGGVHPNPNWSYQRSSSDRFYVVRDNWKYDIQNQQWTELALSPHLIGNWATHNHQILHDRYIPLIGGSYYYQSMLHGQLSDQNPKVLENEGHKPGEYEFIISDDVYAYDLKDDQFIELGKLPFPINKPKWAIYQNQIYLVGGESVPAAGKYKPAGSKSPISGYTYQGEFFGYHSDICLIGKLTTTNNVTTTTTTNNETTTITTN